MHSEPDIREKSGGVALFYHPAYLEHDTGVHPESADRLRAVLRALDRLGIRESDLLRPDPVDQDLLAEVHSPRYIRTIQAAASTGGGYWDLDTYISPGSYDAAVLAAGAAVAAVDNVMSGARSAFALVRPPGHHALRNAAIGFCLFNNMAVAAQHAVRRYGLRRVMIVDWDVHHGNGTQDYFYGRADVLFFSSHRYPFYPGTGAANETGEGTGKGYTLNVPLPVGTGDDGHRQVFRQVVVPAARRYKPELILISAGYDSHLADPLGGMAVTTAGFSELAGITRALADEIPECQGRLAAVLEGGYNVEALAQSVVATIGALGADIGTPVTTDTPEMSTVPPTRRGPDISGVIEQVRKQHGL
jgi:acetoin utilization deacetylase AcuC-like enzyme